jgi:hypothetical protein
MKVGLKMSVMAVDLAIWRIDEGRREEKRGRFRDGWA